MPVKEPADQEVQSEFTKKFGYTALHRKLWSIDGTKYDWYVRRGYRIAAKSRPRPPKPLPAWASKAERVEYLWDCLKTEEELLLELEAREGQSQDVEGRRQEGYEVQRGERG